MSQSTFFSGSSSGVMIFRPEMRVFVPFFLNIKKACTSMKISDSTCWEEIPSVRYYKSIVEMNAQQWI
jgi:hypothetical protein